MALRQARLQSQAPLSPAVNLLRLEVEGADPFEFQAGQWVNLNLKGRDHADRRAYSIASVPAQGQSNTLEVAVTRVEGGKLSPALHALEGGAEVLVDGPYGFFTREGAAMQQPALFVGTGSGVAPLRSMILDALRPSNVSPVPLTLLFGGRTQQDILFHDEFSALAKAHAHFDYRVTLSRADESWSGQRGYVQTHLASLLGERAAEHVYVCGLSAMVKEVRATLKPLGLGRGTVHTERFD